MSYLNSLLTEFSDTRQSLNESNSMTKTLQRRNVTHLALQELQASATASTDVTQLVFETVLSDHSSSITTANNHSGAVLSRLNSSVEKCFRASSKSRELEDTRRTMKWLYSAQR